MLWDGSVISFERIMGFEPLYTYDCQPWVTRSEDAQYTKNLHIL